MRGESMSDHLYVIKRNGTREPVSFDQILQRLQKLAKGLDHVNPDLVALKVCSQIADVSRLQTWMNLQPKRVQ